MLTLTTLLLASQALAPSGLTPQACVATNVTAAGQRPGRGTPTFSVTETLDVELRTRIRPVISGDHLLRLKLLTPRGHLYQTITIPIRVGTAVPDAAEDPLPATRVVPGFPRALAVQTLSGARSEPREAALDAPTGPRRRTVSRDEATARLPVAGTSISMGSLFGRWTVVPYLDDATAPCGPPLTFEIGD